MFAYGFSDTFVRTCLVYVPSGTLVSTNTSLFHRKKMRRSVFDACLFLCRAQIQRHSNLGAGDHVQQTALQQDLSLHSPFPVSETEPLFENGSEEKKSAESTWRCNNRVRLKMMNMLCVLVLHCSNLFPQQGQINRKALNYVGKPEFLHLHLTSGQHHVNKNPIIDCIYLKYKAESKQTNRLMDLLRKTVTNIHSC